ncbi:unnamed protein product [Didymodactylos carnosus]|uniref:Uncharacterized protein n=1 Tax=Didymodactylos carnosus TaxID=1234261 RepID=A0A815IF57_9BILA|nr:unnamed protein product [Didymodactylos carnosus]CAF1364596.1 unnamed protein product [Didymodactylos carnosus]CAF4102387.1 unnamed protein product [Didymodactylos carnosus]CAF4245980.1 unnamed protein product [Didymodactylos carnosus]
MASFSSYNFTKANGVSSDERQKRLVPIVLDAVGALGAVFAGGISVYNTYENGKLADRMDQLQNTIFATIADNGEKKRLCYRNAYGDNYEFFSDRITVVTQLDLINYPLDSSMTKVLATFLFEDRIIDYHEFHVRPVFERKAFVKQKILFIISENS